MYNRGINIHESFFFKGQPTLSNQYFFLDKVTLIDIFKTQKPYPLAKVFVSFN